MSILATTAKVGWNTPSFSVRGPVTIGTLWAPDWFAGSSVMWTAYKTDGFMCHSQYTEANNMWSEGIHAAMGYGSLDNPPKWGWFVLTSSAPNAVPRMHYAAYSESGFLTWIHADCDGSWPTRADSVDYNLGDPFGSACRGNFAVSVGYEYGMIDDEVEATFERSSAQLLEANPGIMFHWPEADGVSWFDQAGDATLISDRISGTWAPSPDPMGYDFTLAPPTPPRSGKVKVGGLTCPVKIWNGVGWEQRPVKIHDGTDWVLAK